MAERLAPGLLATIGLLTGLRFRLFARRLTGRGLVGTFMALLFALGISLGLGVGAYLLFGALPQIASSPVWMAFALSMFVFLVSLFWVIWPVIAAQVDEAYELGRFFCYPVRPLRLYLVQTLAALFEPSVLFFYPAIIGAGIGLSQTLAPGWAATLGLMSAYVFMNVACGRCLQNMFLNLMTSRRSGEFLFAAFLAFLGLAAFIPPVDASWLFGRLGAFGSTPQDMALLVNTARALGSTPPGWLAVGLAAARAAEPRALYSSAALMLSVGGAAWLLGLWLLKRFYRGGKGFRLLPSRARRKDPRAWASAGIKPAFISDTLWAIFTKELRTLFRNPKARLLFAVPFFLLILLKVIGAPQLFRYLWGEAWFAMLLAVLGFYVLAVLAGQFFSNGFGYDGYGVRQVFLLPASLRHWLIGRNLAHGLLALVQFIGLGILLFVFVPGAPQRGLALPFLAFPFGLLVALGAGNLLSIHNPRRFHFDLSRRDRPVGASFAWMLVTLGACLVLVMAAMGISGGSPALLWLTMAALPPVGFFFYMLLLPRARRRLSAEQERIIEVITAG
ncbi:MAG TPA: hypothetical protein VM425_05940 [Myxococcota bacterium]|nr:hypothetical protein [Myxococcota bacterium]